MIPLDLRIQPSLVTKNDKMKKGIAKPRTYISIYSIPDPGLEADNPIIAPMIGPEHGVQPAANPSPINTDPKYPEGLFLKCNFLSLIRNAGVNKPAIMTPNKTMKMAPTCLNISWFSMKNFPKNDEPKPSTIKISENPIKKNSVCSIPLLLIRFESDFRSSSDMPVIYDKNAGYSGNVQGDIKLKNPAPKARNRFKSGAIILSPFIFLSQSYQKKRRNTLNLSVNSL